MPKLIRLSRADADVQQFEALRHNREKRQKLRCFLVEGVRPINQMLAYHWHVEAFIVAQGRALSDWALAILANSQARLHYELAPDLFARLSGKQEPSELLAVVRMPPDSLDRIALRPDLLVVVFDRPQNPGNLGTLLRSADALGAHGLIITGHAADLYDPETLSASTGSLFALPALRMPSPRELEPWFQQIQQQIGDIQVVGSDEAGAIAVAEHSWQRPTILVLGNETWGMSAHFRSRCDTMVAIPIGGSASSLNVACAGSILLYEIAQQRRSFSL
jgi:23S rRNA (uridine2479-2'-O)-methyltransferase